jgi:hypothetical protein
LVGEISHSLIALHAYFWSPPFARPCRRRELGLLSQRGAEAVRIHYTTNKKIISFHRLFLCALIPSSSLSFLSVRQSQGSTIYFVRASYGWLCSSSSHICILYILSLSLSLFLFVPPRFRRSGEVKWTPSSSSRRRDGEDASLYTINTNVVKRGGGQLVTSSRG